MAGRICHHCKQPVAEGEQHDCWTTTEEALTRGLSEDLRDAWERLRETAVTFGDQRIYASHHCIMFSRRSCYFFVRPKKNFLEVCIFLRRELKAPQVRRADRASKSKIVNIVQIRHRDEVEAPITGWLREAYCLQDEAILPAAAFQAGVTRNARLPSDRRERPGVSGNKRPATQRPGSRSRRKRSEPGSRRAGPR